MRVGRAGAEPSLTHPLSFNRWLQPPQPPPVSTKAHLWTGSVVWFSETQTSWSSVVSCRNCYNGDVSQRCYSLPRVYNEK